MKRVVFLVYGVACYGLFFLVYGLFAAFVGNGLGARSIDGPAATSAASPETTSPAVALAVNLGLLALFAVQHSVMARPAFKRVWTRVVPQPIERSTYVLASNLVLMALIWFWQPLPAVIWDVRDSVGRGLLWALFAAGWLFVPAVSLMINHFDLFGTRQVWLYAQGKAYEPLPFQVPLAYGWVRHPLYVGWMVAFWAIPTMTVGHLLLAGVLSGYMVIASWVEERDLVAHFGEAYESYRRQVPAFVPRLPVRNALARSQEAAVPRTDEV